MPSKDETKMEFAARMENIFSESIGIPVSHYYSDNALIFGKALSLEVPIEGMIIKSKKNKNLLRYKNYDAIFYNQRRCSRRSGI